MFASPRSAGKRLQFRGDILPAHELTSTSLLGVDLALFSAGSAIPREFAPAAVRNGCTVIDSSSAFRLKRQCLSWCRK
ncbi:hypothetical protein AB3X92_31135 [Paraburkholderia sp. BR14317]|uniref:hypothetical protein n=1 Tax=unclassified Paraburkholderia TaxID=2615204 RepID=UPI0034CF8F5B